MLKFWNKLSPINQFLIGFVGLMALFYAMYRSSFYEKFLMKPLLSLQAKLASIVLNLLGYDTESNGEILAGNSFSVSIHDGCDGVEATAVYLVAIIAFPLVAFAKKWKGLIMGVTVLFILNIFRISLLYISGIKWPTLFEFLHLHGGVIIFILFAIVLWLIWVNSILKEHNE